jgi:hypothetical protein
MRKTWNFEVKRHSIKVVNSWLHGMKLYVDGDFRDRDRSFFVFGGEVMLSANLSEVGVIEIEPRSFVTVEIDVYLSKDGKRQLVFSSTKRLSLSQQRDIR